MVAEQKRNLMALQRANVIINKQDLFWKFMRYMNCNAKMWDEEECSYDCVARQSEIHFAHLSKAIIIRSMY